MILNGFGIQLANVDARISLGNIGDDKFNASLNFFKGVSFWLSHFDIVHRYDRSCIVTDPRNLKKADFFCLAQKHPPTIRHVVKFYTYFIACILIVVAVQGGIASENWQHIGTSNVPSKIWLCIWAGWFRNWRFGMNWNTKFSITL